MDKKPFSKIDYKKNDYKAKEIASRFLLWDGRFVLETPLNKQLEQYEKYDFCVKHIDSQKIIKIETEHKIEGWTKSGKWEGWRTLDIPYRKKNSEADIFIMHNKLWDTLAVIMMYKVKKSLVYKKNTKCSNAKTNNESFLAVSLNDVRFFKTISRDRRQWVEISKNGNILDKEMKNG